MSDVKRVKLVSSDDVIVEVDVDAVKLSICINDCLQNLGLEKMEEFEKMAPIPVLKVAGDILIKIVSYLEHHKDDAPSPVEAGEEREARTDDLSAWDAEYFKVDNRVLFDLICAANFMNVKSLLENACKVVANMIKGKSPEQIRQAFGIQNDYTPEEEAKIRKENAWWEEE